MPNAASLSFLWHCIYQQNNKFNDHIHVTYVIQKNYSEYHNVVLGYYFSIEGENDLKTLFPEIANELDVLKNRGITPEKVAVKSGKRLWWKCNKGHEWRTTAAHRTTEGNGCPYCSGKKAIKGETDLFTCYPDIVKEWNYERNRSLGPWDLLPHSNRKVWWICKNGHEWKRSPSAMLKSLGCPICNDVPKK